MTYFEELSWLIFTLALPKIWRKFAAEWPMRRGAGRRVEDVRLVGAAKYVDAATTAVLVAAGLHDLGESRPQELWRKAETLPDPAIRWHLIGHLQRNKVRKTLPGAWLIHSADSLRLLQEIDRDAAALGRTAVVLLELNVSGDAAKHGLPPESVECCCPTSPLCAVRVMGLMTMASHEGGRAQRKGFARLREVRERLARCCPPEISLAELSMGMSDDFDLAIEEGATMVRVGSALFEGIER